MILKKHLIHPLYHLEFFFILLTTIIQAEKEVR